MSAYNKLLEILRVGFLVSVGVKIRNKLKLELIQNIYSINHTCWLGPESKSTFI